MEKDNAFIGDVNSSRLVKFPLQCQRLLLDTKTVIVFASNKLYSHSLKGSEMLHGHMEGSMKSKTVTRESVVLLE